MLINSLTFCSYNFFLDDREMAVAAARPWTRFLYPFAVFCVISFVYCTYMFINIYPQIKSHMLNKNERMTDLHAVKSSLGEIIAITIIFHFFFIMMLISYFRATFSSPGYIPETSFWKEGDFVILERHNALIRDLINDLHMPITDEAKQVIRQLPVVERKQQSGKFRFCKLCTSFKPDRSHHCNVCGKCILRMDHHCPWVNNCIGYSNYKFFMLLLIYLDLTLAFVLGTMMERFINVFKPMMSVSRFLLEDMPVILSYVICVFLLGALVMFTWYHITLINRALTTIESKEKLNSRDPSIVRRWEIANIKFNLDSTYLNFRHVMGSPLSWWLPVDVNNFDEDGGTYRFGPWMDIDNHGVEKDVGDGMGKYANV